MKRFVMECPKNMFIAVFLYLDRMEKEGKLVFENESQREALLKDIESDINNYIETVMSYENKLKKLPHALPQSHIISKHLFSGINYVKEKGFAVYTDADKNLSLTTKYNVNINLDTSEILTNDTRKLLVSQQARNIYLKNEENKVYLGLGSSAKVSSYIENFIQKYLNNFYADSNILDSSEIDKLSQIIQSRSLKQEVANFFTAKNLKLTEFVLDFDETNTENIILAIQEDHELNSSLAILGFNNEHFFQNLLEETNKSYKEHLINTVIERTNSFADFYDSMKYRYTSPENAEFLDAISVAKTLDFNFTYEPLTNDIGFLFYKNSRDASVLNFTKLDSKQSVLTDKLNEKIDISCVPERVTIEIGKSKPSIILDYDNNKVNTLKSSSERTDRTYLYNSNITKGDIKLLVIDESDTNKYGTLSKVIQNIAKNAQNIISATGTGITGTGRSIVPQLANSGTIDNIEELEKQYAQLCGVFEIKSQFIRVLAKVSNEEEVMKSALKNCILEINQAFITKKTENINSIVENFVNNVVRFIKNSDKYNVLIERINIYEAIKSTNNVLISMTKDKETMRRFNELNGYQLLENYIFSLKSNVVKEVAGIQPNTLSALLTAQSDTNIDIQTRYLLTNSPETLSLLDKSNQLLTEQEILNGNFNDKLKSLNDYAPFAIMEAFKKKAELNFTSQIYALLRDNFNSFIDAFRQNDSVSKLNAKLLCEDSDFTPKDLIFYSSRSGTSTSDDAKDLYTIYLKNNGTLPQKTLESLNEKQIKVFEHLKNSFQELFIEPYMLEINTELAKEYQMPFYVPAMLYSIYGENKEIKQHLKFENSYPFIAMDDNGNENIPMTFSVPISYMKESWKSFVEKPIEDVMYLVNNETLEVMENFSSLGKSEQIKDSINKKESPIVVSSRVTTSLINLYDLIAQASLREDTNQKFLILANATSQTSSAFANVNKTFLTSKNIEVKIIDASSVAVEIEKAKSRNIQFAVASNYIPISRGLSLAGLGTMHITDSIDRHNDGIQLIARQYNPHEKCAENNYKGWTEGRITAFNNGTSSFWIKPDNTTSTIGKFIDEIEENLTFQDGRILISDNLFSIGDIVEKYVNSSDKVFGLKNTYSSSINTELFNAYNVYQGFTSGEMANTDITNTVDAIELTDAYKKRVNFPSTESTISRNGNVDFMN